MAFERFEAARREVKPFPAVNVTAKGNTLLNKAARSALWKGPPCRMDVYIDRESGRIGLDPLGDDAKVMVSSGQCYALRQALLELGGLVPGRTYRIVPVELPPVSWQIVVKEAGR